MAENKLFVILSGPSGVGKGPLRDTVDLVDSNLLKARPVLYTSRKKRPGEIDGKHYHFRSEEEIREFEPDLDYAVAPVRSDLQAINLTEVEQLLEKHKVVFAEVFCTFGDTLRKRAASKGVPFKSVFLSPLPHGAPPADVVAVMAGKLNRRATDDPDKIRERAASAPFELVKAGDYTHRLVNTAGEDDIAQWGEFGTCCGAKGSRSIKTLADLGERARWLVDTFVRIVNCEIDTMQDGKWLPESVGSLDIPAA